MYDTTFYLTIEINHISHTSKYEICEIEKLDKDQLYFQINAFIGSILKEYSPCRYNDIKSFGISNTKRFDKYISPYDVYETFCENYDNAEMFNNNIKQILNKCINAIKYDLENCKNIAKDMIKYGILRINSTLEECNHK